MSYIPSANEYLEIARGRVGTARLRNIVCRRKNTGASYEDVSELTPGLIPTPPGTALLEIVSTNAADDGSPGGTGIRTVVIKYLDSSFVEREETVTLDGTTVVATTLTDYIYRIQEFRAASVGSGGVAAGDITLQSTGGATVYAKISTGKNQDFRGMFTVPTGKRAIAYKLVAALFDTELDVRLVAERGLKDATRIPGIFFVQAELIGKNASHSIDLPLIKFEAGTDIKLQVEDADATGLSTTECLLTLIVEDDN